jgi:hypothetical protein
MCRLVADGARTIDFTVGDVSKLPEAVGNPNAPVGSAYSQSYNNLMQIAFASVARSGVRGGSGVEQHCAYGQRIADNRPTGRR